MGVYCIYDNRCNHSDIDNSMKQTDKMRRQISQFSEWLATQNNEKLMKVSSAPINPHDPPNASENTNPSGLKTDIYGNKSK